MEKVKYNNPQKVLDFADKLWNELVEKNRIDIGQKQKKAPTVRERNMVFEESIRHPDVREIGSEFCSVTGYPIEKITKDKLYKSSLKLFSEKEKIENFLSVKTNQLFAIEDRIYIYDLTNTYFEGSKRRSKIAKFGRSKEKRSDCKIVVLALVINPAGFIKYSTIFEGNMQDSNTLKAIVTNLRGQTSTAKRAVVVIDAGIATEENLRMLTENNFDYVCVSRCKLKDYRIR